MTFFHPERKDLGSMKVLLKHCLHFVCLVILSPLSLLYHLTRSEDLFVGQGQCLSLIPGKLGSYLRVAYYRLTLKSCSSHGYIGFGTFFAHPDCEMGRGYYLGAYCIIGKARIGDHVTIGSGVHILSGKHQHGFAEIGKPIQDQKGKFVKIGIGENCWIGNKAVIMADLGRQTIVGAGSVVTAPTEDFVILGGNPAKIIGRLTIDGGSDFTRQAEPETRPKGLEQ
jgi:acetyltransferase-like isoleucine patch superfamily enzyme